MFSKCTYLLVAIILSFFTYVYRYQYPAHFFWDENYHIASAQKYLNGVYFMEPHPPLGKMLIALGEKIVHPNLANDQFIATDYGKDPPDDFSFAGYRLFPTLFAWATVPVFFLILLNFSVSPKIAFLASFPLIFDTALIVHFRAAMLEPIQILFLLLAVLASAFSYSRQRLSWPIVIGFGVAIGLGVATKITGLIGLAFLPLLIWNAPLNRKAIATGLVLLLTVFVPVFFWGLHSVIGRRVITDLPNSGMYQARQTYKEVLNGAPWTPVRMYSAIKDHLGFIEHYNKGVPLLNMCKDGENGSLPILWPLGSRSINYRWESNGDATRYLYLQANPFAWAVSLLGVLGGICCCVAAVFSKERILDNKQIVLIGTLTVSWLGYMTFLQQLGRVMYLYHYFIPLMFGFLLFPLVLEQIRYVNGWVISAFHRDTVLTGFSVLVLVGFLIFAPFAYYKPLTDEEVKSRAWLSLWDLRCKNCEPLNPYARPVKGGG